MYPCPCCGYLIHEEPPGSYDICPICFWEDDIAQLRFPEMTGGANKVSLIEGQKNYASFGACEKRIQAHVRTPKPNETRDPLWRPIDLQKDKIERHGQSKNYLDVSTSGYPKNSIELYYWRK